MDRQPINGLKIIYDNQTYEKILYIDIHSVNEYNNHEVSFTVMINEKDTMNINCMLKDIEIITK